MAATRIATLQIGGGASRQGTVRTVGGLSRQGTVFLGQQPYQLATFSIGNRLFQDNFDPPPDNSHRMRGGKYFDSGELKPFKRQGI